MSTPAAQSTPNRSTNRADVQSNLLADRIERWFIQVKPILPWFLAAIAAIVIIAITVSLISGKAAKREAIGWSDIYFAQAAAPQLETVSEDFEGTTASLWAKQIAADAKLNDALLQVYLDRDIAMQKIKEARADYEFVSENTRDPMLAIRASLGIAKTYDSEADADQAIKAYQEIMSMEGADEQVKQAVAERIAFIQSERGKEFFAWFKENAPSNPRPTGAAEDLNKLPTAPDIKFSIPNAPASGASGPAPEASSEINLPSADQQPAASTEANVQLPTEAATPADANAPAAATEQPASDPAPATTEGSSAEAPEAASDAETK